MVGRLKTLVLSLLFWSQGLACGSAYSTSAVAPRWTLEVGAEHLWPTHADRRIATTSVNAVAGRGAFDSCCFAWRAGVTATSATGYIIQLDEGLHDMRLDSDAIGIGPTGIVRVQTPELARFVLSFEGSGAVILYGRGFPSGGDIYNFMWRTGPSVSHRFSESWSAGVGARVMHVSNGQGLTPKNPSYEARGLTFWLAWML